MSPPSQIDALSEVVSAVGGKVDVFLDGGVRQGSDVLKALAMGAKAVFIGRPVLWGLAYKVEVLSPQCTVRSLSHRAKKEWNRFCRSSRMSSKWPCNYQVRIVLSLRV